MQGINGYKIPHFPIVGLRKISDLIYFDGPLLSHFVDEKGENFLFYWVDVDEFSNRWIVFRTYISDINDFLNKKNSLLSLLKKSLNAYIVDIDGDLTYRNMWLILVSELPNSYMPEDDSYYDSELSSEEMNLSYYSDKYGKGILQIHFGSSDKVEYGAIDLGFYSRAMIHFSEMNNSLSNSYYKTENSKQIFRNKNSAKGTKPTVITKQDFLNKIQFKLITTQAASFAILLKASDDELPFDNEIPTRADKYIEYVTDFINSSEELGRLKKFVTPNLELGAINHYESFLKLLEENHCNFEIGYYNSKSKNKFGRKISNDQTYRIIKNLQTFDYDETTTFAMDGKFVSLNIKNGHYSFEGVDSKSTGKLESNAFSQSYTIAFNKIYKITIERRTIKKAAGKKPVEQDVILDFEEIGSVELPIVIDDVKW